MNFVTGSFKMKFSLRLVYPITDRLITDRLQTVSLRHRKPISRKYMVSLKDHVFSTTWLVIRYLLINVVISNSA